MLIDVLFLLTMIGASTSLITIFLKLCCKGEATTTSHVMSIVDLTFAICLLCWLLYASLSRMSHTGRVCSGAFQSINEVMYPYDYQQGNLLFYIVIAGWTVPTIALVTSSIMCPRKSSLYKPSSEFQDLSEPSLSKSFGGDISAI